MKGYCLFPSKVQGLYYMLDLFPKETTIQHELIFFRKSPGQGFRRSLKDGVSRDLLPGELTGHWWREIQPYRRCPFSVQRGLSRERRFPGAGDARDDDSSCGIVTLIFLRLCWRVRLRGIFFILHRGRGLCRYFEK